MHQFVHMNIQLGRQAWPYFDDFFFYGDLAFAVVFTCLGWSCWAAVSASRLHCIHVSSCCSTAAASVMKPYETRTRTEGGDDDPTVLPGDYIFQICFKLAGLSGGVQLMG